MPLFAEKAPLSIFPGLHQPSVEIRQGVVYKRHGHAAGGIDGAEPAVLPHQHRETIAEKGEVHKDGVPRLPLKTADIFQRDGHPALLVYVSHPEFRDIVPHQCPPFPEFADKVVIPGDGMERKRRFHAVPPHSCQNSETGPSHTPLTRPAGLLQNGQLA